MFGKKHKYWRRPKGDALHPDTLAQHLPNGEALYRQVKEAEAFFTTSSRAGGGGTHAGSVGLRFIDRKTSARLHEQFTEPDKGGSKPKAPEVNLHEFIGDQIPEGPKVNVVSVPSNYCPGCDSVAPGGGFQPYMFTEPRSKRFTTQPVVISVAPVMEPWPEAGLVPGDILRHILCGRCAKEMRYGSGSRLKVVIKTVNGPEEVPAGVYEYARFNQRVQENLERFIRTTWTLRKEKTFFGHEGEDLSKER